jgi:proteasome lid subunit RPN8/RPN11
VTIARHVLDDILAHARQTRPRECCGILLGDADRILTSLRAENLADDPLRRFLIDPRDHFAARRVARAEGLFVVGFYHSHPAGAAVPSETDLDEALYPDAVMLIVSIASEPGEGRLFRLRRDGADELPLEVR